MKGTHRFRIKGKLAPCYIGPFRILARHGHVAYKLELPPQFSHIHDAFHVSQLHCCFKESPHRAVDHEMLDLQDDLSYKEHPIRILDQAERRTCQKTTKFLKCSGRIILKMKPLGNARIVFVKNTPMFFPLSLKFSGREFL